jgi:hypothetical protein
MPGPTLTSSLVEGETHEGAGWQWKMSALRAENDPSQKERLEAASLPQTDAAQHAFVRKAQEAIPDCQLRALFSVV